MSTARGKKVARAKTNGSISSENNNQTQQQNEYKSLPFNFTPPQK